MSTENEALKSGNEEQDIGQESDDDGGDHKPRTLPPQRSISKRASLYVAQYQEKASKEKVALIATCALLIASAPAIAAVIVADDYDPDTSPCNQRKYVIDLQIYLYVAGGVQLAFAGIYFLTQIVAFLCFSEEIWIKLRFYMSNGVCGFISACYPLWHLAWAIIGVYIYAVQMSDECQQETIGVMILIWIIIEFIGVCYAGCCGFLVIMALLNAD